MYMALFMAFANIKSPKALIISRFGNIGYSHYQSILSIYYLHLNPNFPLQHLTVHFSKHSLSGCKYVVPHDSLPATHLGNMQECTLLRHNGQSSFEIGHAFHWTCVFLLKLALQESLLEFALQGLEVV